MKLDLYQIDAFAGEVFKGNPAAVCPLESWLPEEIMQNIAMENNLAETAFFVENDGRYQLRWFTPEVEVDLCGHATLASAYVLFNFLDHKNEIILFDTKSGELAVEKNGDFLKMNFPANPPEEVNIPDGMEQALGVKPLECYKAKDYLVVLENEQRVRDVSPDFLALKKLDARGIIITAPGDEVDFVSRFFAPAVGINEDPVTGSAHTTLAPYWCKRLAKDELTGRQISMRGGTVKCTVKGDRVELAGFARAYMTGTIQLPD